jgi:DNA-binding beta-propeller fold protein YncE
MRDWSAQRQHRRWVKYSCLMVTGMILFSFLAISTPAKKKKKPKKPKNPAYSVPVKANDLLYVGSQDRLYAAAAADSSQLPNSIVVINPHNGQIQSSIAVDGEPLELALADDQSVLYASLQGPKVARLNLASNSIDLEFPVVPWPVHDPCSSPQVADIKVMPAQPGTVAVSLWCPELLENDGIALYDNGVQRPLISPWDLGTNVVSFGSAGVLYAGNTLNTGFDLYEFSVSDQGLTLVKDLGGFLDSFNEEIQVGNGLLYTQKGAVVNLSQLLMQGRFYTAETEFAESFALDLNSNRAYFGALEEGGYTLVSFDTQTYQVVGYYNTFNAGSPSNLQITNAYRMAVCSGTGLAVASIGINEGSYEIGNNSIVIFPFELLAPVTYTNPKPQPLSTAVRTINLPHNGLVYDPTRQLFYASTPGAAGNIGNSVVPVDPIAGTVGDPVWVGSDPWQMAVSSDGQYLYVSLYNSFAIRRVTLPSMSSDLFFNVYGSCISGVSQCVTRAGEILAIPGSPQSIVVARMDDPASDTPISEGVAVYDNDVQRTAASPGFPWGNVGPMDVIQLSAAGDAVYGDDTELSDARFANFSLDAQGVHLVFSNVNVGGGGSDMKCQNDECFTNGGLFIDPIAGTDLGVIQSLPYPEEFLLAVLPDLNRNRIYYLASDEDGYISILAYDATSRQEVASFNLGFAGGPVADFQIWNNDDQLAFSVGDNIVFVPLALLQPVSGG